jgi:hypothetical protein
MISTATTLTGIAQSTIKKLGANKQGGLSKAITVTSVDLKYRRVQLSKPAKQIPIAVIIRNQWQSCDVVYGFGGIPYSYGYVPVGSNKNGK